VRKKAWRVTEKKKSQRIFLQEEKKERERKRKREITNGLTLNILKDLSFPQFIQKMKNARWNLPEGMKKKKRKNPP
jgi:hypothetical protein